MTDRPHHPTAIMGGSFDPPHIGHVAVIKELFESRAFDKIWVVPSGFNHLKSPGTSPHHRLAMAEIAFQNLGVEITDIEIRQSERGTPTSTYETLGEFNLRGWVTDRKSTFVLGTDQWSQIHNWKSFPALLSQCDWAVLARKGTSLSHVIQESQAKGLFRKTMGSSSHPRFELQGGTMVSFLPTQAPELSSAFIRAEIELGRPVSAYLPKGILDYLNENKVYGRAF